MREGRLSSASSGLTPGQLGERLAGLPVTIDEVTVERGSVEVPGYYDGAARPTGIAVLRGRGLEGRGECVAWYADEQDAFAAAAPGLAAPGDTTVGALSRALAGAADDPYHRVAVEGAAIDLALRQAERSVFDLADRRPRSIRFCHSIGRDAITAAGGPVAAVEALLDALPGARVKLDVLPTGFADAAWQALAAAGRVVVVDFKREGDPAQVERAHAALPEAWIEDPSPQAIEAAARRGGAAWTARASLDGYVSRAADLADPPLPPGAINVKAPRVGGWLEALRCLEVVRQRGWSAYFGGMFEVGVGRRQARVLAALYTGGAWNDLAPLGTAEHEGGASTSLPAPADRPGFGRA